MPRALLTLTVLPERYAVCRLDPDLPPGTWMMHGPFWSIIRTTEECSIVCDEHLVPQGTLAASGWRVLRCEGPLDFALVGIMASIADPLAEAGVSIFPLATYDTDYVMVKDSQLDAARKALRAYGHAVQD